MNKPRWKDYDLGWCQWPRCKEDGGVHYVLGATKWIDIEEGVSLCSEHDKMMGQELFPDPVCPVKVGDRVWLAEMEDYPREQVYVRDWFLGGSKILLLVSDDRDTPHDDCEEVDLDMIES